MLNEKGYIRGPFGSSLRKDDLKNEGIPVYEQQHAIYNHRNFRYYVDNEKYQTLSRFTVNTDDLIISCSGTIGKVSLIKNNDPKGIINQALLLLRVNKKLINPKFLKYYLETVKGHNSLVSTSSGSSQTNIAKKDVIINMKFKIPSLDEQEKLINFLYTIDKKIELMEKKISINKIIRKQYINDFYTKDKENFIPLGNFIKQLSTKNKENKEYEVLSINNKKGFVKQKDQFGEHEVASSDKHNYKIILNGNYAYNPARINVGSIARLEEFDNGIISPMYIMFDIKNKELTSDYFKFYLDSETFKYNMLKRLEGSVRQTLSFDALKNIPIPLPNYETQEKISKFLKVYDQEINLLQQKIITNKKFKQTLLSKMFC